MNSRGSLGDAMLRVVLEDMKRKTACLGLLCSALLFVNCHVQHRDFPVLKGPYLGQKPLGLKPEVFAPGIVSTKAYELHGCFSPDGKEFFTTRRPTFEGDDNQLMLMKEEDGTWTKPDQPHSIRTASDCSHAFPQMERRCS